MINKIFWLSDKIDNKENQDYIKRFEEECQNFRIIPYKEIDILLYRIKKEDFNSCVVILGGRTFPLYIEKIKTDKNLFSIPLVIIFTKKKNKFIQNIEKECGKYLYHKYYNILGIVDTYKDLKEKILSYEQELNKKLSEINLGKIDRPKEYEKCLTFEYLQDSSQLIFPYLYQKIMSRFKIDYSSVKEFNSFLFKNFGKNEKVLEYLKVFCMCEDVPDDIVAKYWGKIYTLETSFYHNINWSLMKLENKKYNTFIQIFYSGLKDLSFKDENKFLYRGTKLLREEIEKMINFFKDNKNNPESKILIYSRTFLSFSLEEKIAKKFMKNKPVTEKTEKVFFILENKSKDKFLSNADFRRINSNKKEKEILFFPFSSFIIEDINKKDDYYEIKINYIGIYEKEIQNKIEKIKDNPEIIENISDSLFSKDVFRSETMLKEKHESKNNIVDEEISKIKNNRNDKDSFNDIEKLLSKSLIEINEEKVKENEEEKKINEQEKNNKKESEVIKNEYIKFCFCKKDKWYIPKLKKIFNMNIYEYTNIDEIFKIIYSNNIRGKECLIILNERLFPLYIKEIKKCNNKDNIPFLLIYQSINTNIQNKDDFLKYLNDSNFNYFGSVDSYKELKAKIIQIINKLCEEEKKIEKNIKKKDDLPKENSKENLLPEIKNSPNKIKEEKPKEINNSQDSNNVNIIESNDNEILNINFTFGNNYNNLKDSPKIEVQCKCKEKISELIKKYRKKTNDYNENIQFFYQAKKLNPESESTLKEEKIINNAEIMIISKKIIPEDNKINDIKYIDTNNNNNEQTPKNSIKQDNTNNDNNKENEINVIFINKNRNSSEKITVKCNNKEKVSDLIKKYREQENYFDNNITFSHQGRKLNFELTVSEEQIINNSNIIVEKNLPENKKIPEPINEDNLNKKLKIFLINLEANHVQSYDINCKIDKFFEDLCDKDKDINIIKNKLIKGIYEIFINCLNKDKKELNEDDKEYLFNLLKYLYENIATEPEEFINYIKQILENNIDFHNLSKYKEETIEKYIINFMKKPMEQRKKKLKEEYGNNNSKKVIITYEKFTEIILEDNKERIFMDNTATEYLLYKMKKSLIDDEENNYKMNAFDFKIFLDFLDK